MAEEYYPLVHNELKELIECKEAVAYFARPIDRLTKLIPKFLLEIELNRFQLDSEAVPQYVVSRIEAVTNDLQKAKLHLERHKDLFDNPGLVIHIPKDNPEEEGDTYGNETYEKLYADVTVFLKKVQAEQTKYAAMQFEQNPKDGAGNLPLVKIKWDGNNNQLYDVIRQLKEREKKILNSYTDLAVFLKTNFDIFENTSLSTIETELQRGKQPTKSKRIKLDSTDLPK